MSSDWGKWQFVSICLSLVTFCFLDADDFDPSAQTLQLNEKFSELGLEIADKGRKKEKKQICDQFNDDKSSSNKVLPFCQKSKLSAAQNNQVAVDIFGIVDFISLFI